MTIGQLSSYITLLALLATPAQLLPKAYAMLQQAKAAATRIHELDSSVEINKQTTQENTLPITATQNALFTGKNINFSYQEKSVLKDLNFNFDSKGLVCISGESGAGKSTFLQLLLRFIEKGSGEIALEGKALENYDSDTLRKIIAYVPQQNGLFRGTVRDNLLLGRNFSDEQLWSVLDSVGMKVAIEELGLEHVLQEEGTGLSGGHNH